MTLPLDDEFVKAAFEGETLDTSLGMVSCFVLNVGDVLLETGQIVACDPLVFPETDPFTVTVSPGTYPVKLVVAQVSETDQRVAFARISFKSSEVASWRMALIGDQAEKDLAPDEYFGYPVDAGIGCFMDGQTAQALLARMNEENDYYETLIAEMQKTYVHTWSWANLRPSETASGSIVLFSSGWGDGLYASYFGYSRTGELSAFLTDFGVLWRPGAASSEKPPESSKASVPWWKFWAKRGGAA